MECQRTPESHCQAEYEAVIANKALEEPTETVSIAGNIVKKGICWLLMPSAKVKPGDLLAILTTGAYHYSMASNYNRYARPAECLSRKV